MARPSPSSSAASAAPSPSATPVELLVDALNRGVMRAIQTSGRSLPSSATATIPPPENDPPPPSPSPYSPWSSSSPFSPSWSFRCEWIEYSSDLCCPVVESMRPYFPTPLGGGEVGSDGRPLLYSACLGLLLSERRQDGDGDGDGDDDDDDDYDEC